MESLEATLVSIKYRSPDSQWIVATMRDKAGKSFVATGDVPLDNTESYSLCGEWIVDKKYGRQFRTDSFIQVLPKSNEDIIKYLVDTGKVKGFGKSHANRLLENRPFSLADPGSMAGIPLTMAGDIVKCWRDISEINSHSLELHKLGIPPSWADRILKQWSIKEAVDNITRDAYSITEIHGIGFARADGILAKKFPPDLPIRIRAAVLFLLREAVDSGSTFSHEAEVEEAAAKLLKVKKKAAIPKIKIQEAIEYLIQYGNIIPETLTNEFSTIRLLYLPEAYKAERELSELLVERLKTKSDPIDVTKDIEDIQKNDNIRFSDSQVDAIKGAFSNNTFVITGGPGSGKTTCVHTILTLCMFRTWKVILSAPTGRAAKRLEEVSKSNATTIHRLLQWTRTGFLKDRQNRIEADLLIIDEASMLDTQITKCLLKALSPTTRMVFIGDSRQLPSISFGSTLADLSNTRYVPTVTLTQNFRQQAGSLIIRNAELINSGEVPRFPETRGVKEDAYAMWIPRNKSAEGGKDDAEWVNRIVPKLVKEYIPAKYPDIKSEDIQVLVPMHKGTIGAEALNQSLQAVLNPNGRQIGKFRVGDRVMQTVNNYETELYNGDIGYVIEDKAGSNIWVDFDGRTCKVDPREICVAFAQSIHKAQGSEYKATILVMGYQHWPMLSRNLLYTAATRARNLSLFVVSKGVFERAVGHCPEDNRKSYLKHRINNLMRKQ